MNSSISETGHARAIANFEILVDQCAQLGSVYAPSRSDLKLDALQNALAQAKSRLDAFHTAQAGLKSAVARRETLFDGFGRRITRVHNSLKASSSSDAFDEKAHALVVQLRGGHKSSPAKGIPQAQAAKPELVVAGGASAPAPAETLTSGRSSSHLSYEARVDHLDQFLKLLGSMTDYTPLESELTHQGLQEWKNDLQAVNQEVMHAQNVVGTARTERDEILYATRSGLIDLAADCKSYLKAALGTDHPTAKSVTKLKFARTA